MSYVEARGKSLQQAREESEELVSGPQRTILPQKLDDEYGRSR